MRELRKEQRNEKIEFWLDTIILGVMWGMVFGFWSFVWYRVLT